MNKKEFEIVVGPRGILQINNARIAYRNLSGVKTEYNREGDRNFAVIIPSQEIADELIEMGWNVKIKPPRMEGDDPFMYLIVKVKFNDRGPKVYLQSGNSRVILNKDTIGAIDGMDIVNVDLDIRPFDWEVGGRTGRTAYLYAMSVEQELDRFAARHVDMFRSDEAF